MSDLSHQYILGVNSMDKAQPLPVDEWPVLILKQEIMHFCALPTRRRRIWTFGKVV